MKRLSALALASVLAVGLTACSRDDAPATTATSTAAPADAAGAIERSAADLRSGDLLAVVRNALPPEHFERMRTEWSTRSAEPPSDEDRQKFAETMAKLTAADAEAALYAEFEPQLAQMESEMGAQLPLMVGMGRGFAMQSLQQSEELTAAQKKQAGELIDAMASWIQTAKFFDRDLARQAIATTVSTARAINVQTLDQLQALEFEQALQKGGIALRGAFDVLGLYGLKIDESLANVKATVVSQTDNVAKVEVGYSMFGKPLSFEAEMVEIGGRWYGKDALAEVEKAANAAAMGDDGHDHGHDVDEEAYGDDAEDDNGE